MTVSFHLRSIPLVWMNEKKKYKFPESLPNIIILTRLANVKLLYETVTELPVLFHVHLMHMQ